MCHVSLLNVQNVTILHDLCYVSLSHRILSKSPHLKGCPNVDIKAPPVNTLHITLWYLTCEFVSIWCTVHPCGGHSGTPDLFKAPDHLSNLQQNGPSKESNVSFLALGQIRSSVLKHFNPLTWVWCLIRNRQLRRSNQQSAGDYITKCLFKDTFSLYAFTDIAAPKLRTSDSTDPLSSSFDISV